MVCKHHNSASIRGADLQVACRKKEWRRKSRTMRRITRSQGSKSLRQELGKRKCERSLKVKGARVRSRRGKEEAKKIAAKFLKVKG